MSAAAKDTKSADSYWDMQKMDGSYVIDIKEPVNKTPEEVEKEFAKLIKEMSSLAAIDALLDPIYSYLLKHKKSDLQNQDIKKHTDRKNHQTDITISIPNSSNQVWISHYSSYLVIMHYDAKIKHCDFWSPHIKPHDYIAILRMVSKIQTHLIDPLTVKRYEGMRTYEIMCLAGLTGSTKFQFPVVVKESVQKKLQRLNAGLHYILKGYNTDWEFDSKYNVQNLAYTSKKTVIPINIIGTTYKILLEEVNWSSGDYIHLVLYKGDRILERICITDLIDVPNFFPMLYKGIKDFSKTYQA
ncbi:MAG TPA: hypothetical protein VN704_11670 [Verrucomicrobiae bacterium]|nr:hypothetical protein [Verrucomicrobiae bacterium]